MTVLPARRLPDLLNDDEPLLETTFRVPEAAPAEVPTAIKGTTDGARAKADSLKSLDPQDAPARFGPTTPKSIDPSLLRATRPKQVRSGTGG